jgi:hypothetical protein
MLVCPQGQSEQGQGEESGCRPSGSQQVLPEFRGRAVLEDVV